MKNQALFSSKDKSKKLKCRLLQFLFGPLRVKFSVYSLHFNSSYPGDMSYQFIVNPVISDKEYENTF